MSRLSGERTQRLAEDAHASAGGYEPVEPASRGPSVHAGTPTESRLDVVDYDLHGLVGIRLLNATERDVAAVTRQVGPIRSTLAREPDIVLTFVDRLPLSSRIRYLGLHDAGFTDNAFLVLKRKGPSYAKVQIPFDQIGRRCELVCESGLGLVPFLIPILNLTALGKGFVPIHASAFAYNGTGVLVTGWEKGGKTETLLGFMAKGAEYIGDEWIYVSPNRDRMYGLPEQITIWDWHLDDLPKYRTLMRWQDRSRLQWIKLLRSSERLLPQSVRDGDHLPVVSRATRVLERQLSIRMRPETLFGSRACALAGKLDKVLLLISHESPQVTVERVAPEEVAQRMVFSLQYERRDLQAYYRKFRFAFPSTENPILENQAQAEREMLSEALAGKDAYAVYHPFPAPIPALFEAIDPLLSNGQKL